MLLSSTSTVISLATYIIQKAHKWTDSGRQRCHFTLTSYYTVNIESFTATAKRQFEPRDQDFVIYCSTYLPIKK